MAGINKRCKAETNGHELFVLQLMIDGYSVQDIVKHMMSNMGYVTQSNCMRVIHKAYKIIRQNSESEAQAAKEKYSAMYLQLYKKTLEAKDYKNSIKAIDSLAKLQGLLIQKIEQKTESQVNQKIDLSNITDENLEKMVEIILKKDIE
jgi:hypothetical protein